MLVTALTLISPKSRQMGGYKNSCRVLATAVPQIRDDFSLSANCSEVTLSVSYTSTASYIKVEFSHKFALALCRLLKGITCVWDGITPNLVYTLH